MYTLTQKEAELTQAVAHLRSLPNVKGRCLGFCRAALALIGCSLPPPQVPHSTALLCYEVLARDPAKYGWVRVTEPAAHPITLNFYNNCGHEFGLECGHVALEKDGVLYSSYDYPNSPYFKARLVGQFIPA